MRRGDPEPGGGSGNFFGVAFWAVLLLGLAATSVNSSNRNKLSSPHHSSIYQAPSHHHALHCLYTFHFIFPYLHSTNTFLN